MGGRGLRQPHIAAHTWCIVRVFDDALLACVVVSSWLCCASPQRLMVLSYLFRCLLAVFVPSGMLIRFGVYFILRGCFGLLLRLSCKRSLYVLDTVVSQTRFSPFPSVTCLFILLLAAFEAQRFPVLLASSSSISFSSGARAWRVPPSLSVWFILGSGALVLTLTSSLDATFIPL